MDNPNSILLWCIVAIVLVVGVIVTLEKRRPQWQFYLRKSLHIVVIFVAAFASVNIESWLLPVMSWVASFALWFAIKRGWFEEIVAGEQSRKPWGMVYFSLVFALLTSLPFFLEGLSTQQNLLLRWMNGWAFCTLAWADGLAGMLGRWWSSSLSDRSKWIFKLESERKSWLGFVVFWWVAVLIGGLMLWRLVRVIPDAHWVGAVDWPQLVVFGFVVAMVEMISGKGSDNLFVVLAVWLFSGAMFMGFLGKSQAFFLQGTGFLIVYLLLSVFVAIGLNKWRVLDNTGAVMAWLLAFVVVIMAGWSLWPLVVFLGMASWVERLRKKGASSISGDSKDGKPRDRWQVLANGGLYMGCAVMVYIAEMDVAEIFGCSISPGFGEKCKLLALFTLSASCADTLSSEVGQWLGGEPRSIISGRRLSKGVSGGVTIAGFMVAFLGSVAVAICGILMDWIELRQTYRWGQWQIFILIVGFGLLGTLIDSVMGDLFQRKYIRLGGVLSDVPDKKTEAIAKGFYWMTNDTVNAVTGILTLLLGGLFLF